MSTEYRPIDADAVRSALWLSLYGFSNRYQGETAIDGAYQRQLIVSKLTSCDVIYAIKPQASAWQAVPGNLFEVQDFNTEMWINASFAAEVASLGSGETEKRPTDRSGSSPSPSTARSATSTTSSKSCRTTPRATTGQQVFQRDVSGTPVTASHQ